MSSSQAIPRSSASSRARLLPPERLRQAAGGMLVGLVIDENRAEYARGDYLVRALPARTRRRRDRRGRRGARGPGRLRFHGVMRLRRRRPARVARRGDLAGESVAGPCSSPATGAASTCSRSPTTTPRARGRGRLIRARGLLLWRRDRPVGGPRIPAWLHGDGRGLSRVRPSFCRLVSAGVATLRRPSRALDVRASFLYLAPRLVGTNFGEERGTPMRWLPRRERRRGRNDWPCRDGERRRAPLRRAARPPSTLCAAFSLEVKPRPADRHHGPVGLGQVDADAHPRSARPPDERFVTRSAARGSDSSRTTSSPGSGASTSASSSSSSTCSRC